MIGRKDDPAFLYFPTDYRWSMGLLICLGAAPWAGIEIDEVHRVGRALEEHVGDDRAWFEEWTRMGDKIEARGRDAQANGHARTAASCFLRASRYYQTGERFIHPRSQRSTDIYAKSVKIFRDAAAPSGSPASNRSRCRMRVRACQRFWCIRTLPQRDQSAHHAWCSLMGST